MDTDGSLDEIVARVKELLAEMLGDVEPESIPEGAMLFDAEHAPEGLALDSLDSLKLGLAIAEEYHLEPNVELDYSQVTTLREIAQHVHRLLSLEVV